MTRHLMLSAAIGLALFSVIACSPKYREKDHSKNTDWFHEARVGAFMHFLPDEKTFDLVDKFDVVALADQLEDAGVKVFELTLGQNSGYYNAPNKVYDRITKSKPGEKTSLRDLPMELGLELQKRGISLMLYLPCQTPNRDMHAVESFGFNWSDPRSDKYYTEEGVKNWSKVIAWWAKHYGKLVKGWWFDGAYPFIGFNWAIGRIYAQQVKAYNRHAIVSFNPGVKSYLTRHCRACDYTAGEVNDILDIKIDGRWIEGAQAHVLTYLGSMWGVYGDTRYTDAAIAFWTREFTGAGGVVMYDVGPNYDESRGPIGSISDAQLHQLKIAVEAAFAPSDDQTAKKGGRRKQR